MKTMQPKRITIIPDLHGKLTRDGKMSEPDICWILERWLERHPQVKGRERDIRITRGRWTLPEGVRTEVVSASILPSDDLAGYEPGQDGDLYGYFLADEQDSSKGNCP
jgi:hypothetical protein